MKPVVWIQAPPKQQVAVGNLNRPNDRFITGKFAMMHSDVDTSNSFSKSSSHHRVSCPSPQTRPITTAKLWSAYGRRCSRDCWSSFCLDGHCSLAVGFGEIFLVELFDHRAIGSLDHDRASCPSSSLITHRLTRRPQRHLSSPC